MNEIYEKFRLSDFSEVFDDDQIEVTPALQASDVKDWDSLSHIRLILAVQKAFNIDFAAEEMGNLINVGDLASLIKAKISRRGR